MLNHHLTLCGRVCRMKITNLHSGMVFILSICLESPYSMIHGGIWNDRNDRWKTQHRHGCQMCRPSGLFFVFYLCLQLGNLLSWLSFGNRYVIELDHGLSDIQQDNTRQSFFWGGIREDIRAVNCWTLLQTFWQRAISSVELQPGAPTCCDGSRHDMFWPSC